MNAPYDGERDREAEARRPPAGPAPSRPARSRDPRYGYAQDPYDQDAPENQPPDPRYRGQQPPPDPRAQQGYGYPQGSYGQPHPGQSGHGPDPAADPRLAGAQGQGGGAADPYGGQYGSGYGQYGYDDQYGQGDGSGQYDGGQYGGDQYGSGQYGGDPLTDPYFEQTYGSGLYRPQAPGPDPLAAAYYDRAAHPPPSQPGYGYPQQQDPYPPDAYQGQGQHQGQYGGAPQLDPEQQAAEARARYHQQMQAQQQAQYQQAQQQQAQYQQGHYQQSPQQGAYQHSPYQQPAPGQTGAPPQGGGDAYQGVDEFMSEAYQAPQEDAYAHLFRDQRPSYPYPVQVPPEVEATGTHFIQIPQVTPRQDAADREAGGGGILKSSALMAAGTLVSRLTGFVRTLVIAGAIGVTTLSDVYQVAMVLPTMIYILTIGGGLNSVFVPQLVRAMKEDEDGGEAYANRLLTLVMVILGAIVAITVLAAPLLIKVMSPSIADDPVRMHLAVTFARYCLPTIFFMGIHVVMGQVLNARGRFGAMMWTPVLNNVVVIFAFGAFIWVFGSFSSTRLSADTISPEGVRLLGMGTLLGLVVQALSMVPYLRDAGFKFRPRFDWRGHGLGKAAKLAKWTFLFVLANQAGLIVVTQLATLAGSNAADHGYQGRGITAYNNAQLIWMMPQAIITVSVMAAVLPRISRAADDGDSSAVRDDISYGLRTSAVAIVPAAFLFLAVGVPLSTLLYSSGGHAGARSIGYVLMAFGLGLIPYSVQYVVLRGFYAYEDTKTPFYNTVIVAACNAALSGLSYLVLPVQWAVAGMAASYGLAYAIGVGVAVRRLRRRIGGDLDGPRVVRTYARLVGACVPAAGVAGLLVYWVTGAIGSGAVGSLGAVVVGSISLLGLFFVIGKRMRIEEMTALVGMVRGKLGR